jgi:hypothetical protein
LTRHGNRFKLAGWPATARIGPTRAKLVVQENRSLMERAPTRRGESLDKAARLYRVLSAPLVVTLAGALVAGLLIPRVGARIEDHRKAREIQTSLVQDMSEAVARVAMTGQLVATRSIRKENANGTAVFDTALLTWAVDKVRIEAELRAYFSMARIEGVSVPTAWAGYGRAVDSLTTSAQLSFPTGVIA